MMSRFPFEARCKPTVFVVKLCNLLVVLSSKGDFVICLIPARDSGCLGPREFGQRVEIQAVHGTCEQIGDIGDKAEQW